MSNDEIEREVAMAKLDDARQLIDEIVNACEMRKNCYLGQATQDEYERARDKAADTLAGLLAPEEPFVRPTDTFAAKSAPVKSKAKRK